MEVQTHGGLMFLRFHNEHPDHAALDFFLNLYRMKVLVLPCGSGRGAIKLLPALNISIGDAEKAIAAIRAALSLTRSGIDDE